MSKQKLLRGASGDALALAVVKLMTAALGLLTTRLLSQYLSVYDYGTYSQILLVVSTVSSITIFGMIDGVNFFYCTEKDEKERERIIGSIFSLQCIFSVVAGSIVFLLSAPLCAYFENPEIKRLLIFAVALPMLQNLINMLQVLMISNGKTSLLAVRNLVVSFVRLIVASLIICRVQNIVIVLFTTTLLDLAQIGIFGVLLKKSGCRVCLSRLNSKTLMDIMRYCAPMAVFVILSTLNRDIDKYLIAWLTDTETVAVYSNASKMLPFDIIISAFSTVLLPGVTKAIVEEKYSRARKLYKSFCEISYISTTILCCAALSAAPQLMKLLYSDKYMSGLSIFCIYILVDMVRFTNITMVLTAAGKTKKLMLLSVGSLLVNAILNVILYRLIGIVGPAVATLITTLSLGLTIMSEASKVMDTRLGSLFDVRFLTRFASVSAIFVFLFHVMQRFLERMDVHYFLILVIICGGYVLFMLLINYKRLMKAIYRVNENANTDE